MTDCVLVWTTISADGDPDGLAETLVAERLAACIVVQAPMESFYNWKGRVERDRERQILIKTTAERLPALQARLHELHPYELPEYLVTPIIDGSAEYLEWVRQSVA